MFYENIFMTIFKVLQKLYYLTKIYHIEIFNSINQRLSSIFHILHKCRFSLISAAFYVDRNVNVSYSTFYIILEINLFCILLAAFCI